MSDINWNVQDQNTGKSIKAKAVDASCTISTRDLTTYEGSFNCDIVQSGLSLRRLTADECEALQGFPGSYTRLPSSSDSGRYRALGNSMAVNCMAWIGERIDDADRRG